MFLIDNAAKDFYLFGKNNNYRLPDNQPVKGIYSFY